MIRLVYVSSATKDMAESELMEILEVSRTRNKEEEITGMLLYAGGNFFQILEGEEPNVMNLYRRIAKDVRHKGIIMIDVSEIEYRTFDGWAMGFKYLTNDDASKIEGFSQFMNKNIKPENMTGNKWLILDMLYMFKHDNR